MNEMRRNLFHNLGLTITNADYELFCKFFSYQNRVNTQEDYNRLKSLFHDLNRQAKEGNLNMDVFSPLLDKWLRHAEGSVGPNPTEQDE